MRPIGSAMASSNGRTATSIMPRSTTAASTLGLVASLTPGVSHVAIPKAIADATTERRTRKMRPGMLVERLPRACHCAR